MRGAIPLALATAIALVALAGCETEPVEPEVDPIGRDAISADRLWTRITEEAPYETYSFWPREQGVQPGQAPHGPFHRIFVNRTLIESLPREDRIAPHGSIIVKENMDTGREVTGYTVMAKVDGFDPDNGDWFWARYDTGGDVQAAGAVNSCIVCHAGMESNDYIIVHRLDRPLERDE